MWLVQADDKISSCGTVQALFDGFPRRHEVAQGNEAEIVHERGTQTGCTGTGRRDSRYDRDIHVGIGRAQLINKAGHAVDAGVTTGYEGDRGALLCPFQGHAAAVGLLGHARNDVFFIGIIVPNEVNVRLITGDDITLF